VSGSRLLAGLAVVGALLVARPVPALAEELKTIATRPGVTDSFLLVSPTAPPSAAVILFAGGHGGLALSGAGIGWGGGNFLVRNRGRFAAHGLLVAVIDAPSDRRDHGLWNFRTSAAHAEDVKAVIAALRGLAGVPVWLVGTSMGTISAANAAARLKEGGPDGIVLTSSITRTNRVTGESVPMVKLDRITVPTLVVHHAHDACVVTPYGEARSLLKDLTRASRKELVTFDGGDPPRSDPCEPFAAHGYVGLDELVVTAIADWITGVVKP
jgi:pimeloyl-ACP methyl ester carboxylesterase